MISQSSVQLLCKEPRFKLFYNNSICGFVSRHTSCSTSQPISNVGLQMIQKNKTWRQASRRKNSESQNCTKNNHNKPHHKAIPRKLHIFCKFNPRQIFLRILRSLHSPSVINIDITINRALTVVTTLNIDITINHALTVVTTLWAGRP